MKSRKIGLFLFVFMLIGLSIPALAQNNEREHQAPQQKGMQQGSQVDFTPLLQKTSTLIETRLVTQNNDLIGTVRDLILCKPITEDVQGRESSSRNSSDRGQDNQYRQQSNMGGMEGMQSLTGENRIQYLLVSPNPSLNTGKDFLVVPWSIVQVMPESMSGRTQQGQAQGSSANLGEPAHFVVKLSTDYFKNAPGFSGSDWPDLTSAQFGQQVSSFYGTQESGSAGYHQAEAGGQTAQTAKNEDKYSRVTKIIGLDIVDKDHDTVGSLQDLIVDTRQGVLAFAVIAHGGVLGLGEELAAIPWSIVRFQTSRDELSVPFEKENLDKLAVTNQDFTQLSNPMLAARLYQRFDQRPYWETYGYLPAGQEQRNQQGMTATSYEPQLHKASDLIKSPVFAQNEKIGIVADLILSKPVNMPSGMQGQGGMKQHEMMGNEHNMGGMMGGMQGQGGMEQHGMESQHNMGGMMGGMQGQEGMEQHGMNTQRPMGGMMDNGSENRIGFVVISPNDNLKIQKDYFVVPWEIVQLRPQTMESSGQSGQTNQQQNTLPGKPQELVLRTTPSNLKAAPSFDKTAWPNFCDLPYQQSVYQYFNVTEPRFVTAGIRAMQGGQGQQGQTMTDTSKFHRLSLLMNTEIVDESNSKVGVLQDAFIDAKDGVVAFAILSRSGWLGMNKELAAIPWSVLNYETKENRFQVPLEKDKLDQLAVASSDFSQLNEATLTRRVYERFDRRPYWETYGAIQEQQGMQGQEQRNQPQHREQQDQPSGERKY